MPNINESKESVRLVMLAFPITKKTTFSKTWRRYPTFDMFATSMTATVPCQFQLLQQV